MNEPYIVEKTVVTPYGDKFHMKYLEDSDGFGSHTQLEALYNGEQIAIYSNFGRAYGILSGVSSGEERFNIVMDMRAEGQIRAYRFDWCIIYTTDGGNSFQGEIVERYPDRYRTDKEFAQIYGMLYETPFYDERLAEHLDMNKQRLPDSEAAERAVEYAKSVRKERYVHISEIESLVGKAQRCILVFMSDDGRKVNNVSLEYDLSNGQILVMEYSNMSNNDEIDLYVTSFMVRDLYVPEESGGVVSPALTGYAGQTVETAIVVDEQRTDFPSITEIKKIRPGMSYENVNKLLGDPYESILNEEENKISYKLEDDGKYILTLKQGRSGAYVHATSFYSNLSGVVYNEALYKLKYSKWKWIWPDVSRACEVEIGMTAGEVEALIGIPQYREGSGLIREVYYLNGAYSAKLYYSYTDKEKEPVVCQIDIAPLTWETNSDYYLITAANIIIPALIVIAIIVISLMFYRRRKHKDFKKDSSI